MAVPVYLVETEALKLYSFEPVIQAGVLSASKCQLQYLNEGGANFVFRITPSGSEKLHSQLQGKLLRIRKDLPTVPGAEEQIHALDANFRDLFRAENLVHHELISLEEGVLASLNQMLQSMIRPSHRASDYLPVEEMSGLLVTDMTPTADSILLQLKPKWLAQSSNAPVDAKRCRTCAVRAQRRSQNIRTATDAQENCPLDLIIPDLDRRREAILAITPDTLLREYLLDDAQSLLQQLRASQIANDQDGILTASTSDAIYNLCKAMTLRDCTLFLRRTGNNIEARLGDLDLKQPEKLARWKQMESNLINEGWYTNTEDEGHWVQERICQLSR